MPRSGYLITQARDGKAGPGSIRTATPSVRGHSFAAGATETTAAAVIRTKAAVDPMVTSPNTADIGATFGIGAIVVIIGATASVVLAWSRNRRGSPARNVWHVNWWSDREPVLIDRSSNPS
jgi:hypothetical protein